MLLPTAAADPAAAAAAAAAPAPGTPGGSANELVLGRPLPLISLCRGHGAAGFLDPRPLPTPVTVT